MGQAADGVNQIGFGVGAEIAAGPFDDAPVDIDIILFRFPLMGFEGTHIDFGRCVLNIRKVCCGVAGLVDAGNFIVTALERDADIVEACIVCRGRTVLIDEIGSGVDDFDFALFGQLIGDDPARVADGHAIGDIAKVIDAEGDAVADTRVGGVTLVMGAEALVGGGEIDGVVVGVTVGLFGLKRFYQVAGLGDGVRVKRLFRRVASIDFGAQDGAP